MKKITRSATSSPKPKKASILNRVKKVAELPDVISAVLYGRSGTGKTTISATFPKPMLVLDISEKGTDSISDVTGVEVLKVVDWQDIEDIYWELKDGQTKYKSVSIDSAHAMQALAIKKARESRGVEDDAQTTKHDFMMASGLMLRWLEAYRDLQDDGIHVAFLVHDRLTGGDDDDSSDGQINPEVGPRLMPSVSSFLMGAVNIVGNTFVRERQLMNNGKKVMGKKGRVIEYCLRLGPNAYYATKVRSPKSREVPAFIKDPTFQRIMEVRKGVTPQDEEGAATPRVKKKKIVKR